MTRAGSFKAMKAREHEEYLVNTLDATNALAARATEDEVLAMEIVSGLKRPDAKHTLSWCKKTLRQRSDADIQLIFTLVVQNALATGDVGMLAKLKELLPYVATKVPTQISGPDEGAIPVRFIIEE